MTAESSGPTGRRAPRVFLALLKRISGRALAATLVASLWAADARAEIVSSPVTEARVGEPYRYDVVAQGTGNVEITAPNGLPPWLTLTQTGNGTATLGGTPRSGDNGAGITLRAEDTICRAFLFFCYDFQTFDITIKQNNAPTVVSPGLEDLVSLEGEPFSLDVAAAFTDPDGDRLTFTATGLPQSLSLDGAVLSGTPTQADGLDSPFDVTVTADDGNGGRVSDSFRLVVTLLDRADISVESIEPSPAPAMRGEPVEWVVTVANAGPSATDGVELVVEFRGNPFTFGDHPCTLTVADDRQRLDCTTGPIASGESATLTIAGSAAQAGDAYVTASVSAPGVPIDPQQRQRQRLRRAERRARDQRRCRTERSGADATSARRPISTATASTMSPSRPAPTSRRRYT
jgi:hypothetical protein